MDIIYQKKKKIGTPLSEFNDFSNEVNDKESRTKWREISSNLKQDRKIFLNRDED